MAQLSPKALSFLERYSKHHNIPMKDAAASILEEATDDPRYSAFVEKADVVTDDAFPEVTQTPTVPVSSDAEERKGGKPTVVRIGSVANDARYWKEMMLLVVDYALANKIPVPPNWFRADASRLTMQASDGRHLYTNYSFPDNLALIRKLLAVGSWPVVSVDVVYKDGPDATITLNAVQAPAAVVPVAAPPDED